MKKTIMIAFALGMPCLAGQPVTTIAPAPVVKPVRTCADSPWSMEIGANYNFAMRDLLKHSQGACKSVDTMGGELTLVHRNSERDSMYLRLGYAYGGESNGGFYGFRNDNIKLNTHTFALTTGYRYTRPLTERISMYMGAGIGVANQSIKTKFTADGFDRHHGRGHGRDFSYKAHDASWGFAVEAEAGLRYQICTCWDVFVAYRFSANTAKNSLGSGDAHFTDFSRNHRQFFHGINAGVAFKF